MPGASCAGHRFSVFSAAAPQTAVGLAAAAAASAVAGTATRAEAATATTGPAR